MQRSYKKLHTGLFNTSIILLLAYWISFSAFFYTGSCIHNYNPAPGADVKTYNEIIINKADSDASGFKLMNFPQEPDGNIFTSVSMSFLQRHSFKEASILLSNSLHRAVLHLQKLHTFSFFSHLTDLFGSNLFGIDLFGLLLLISTLLLFRSVSISDAFSLYDLKVRLND